MRIFRLAMAQINTTVGDLKGNTDKIIRYIGEAREFGAEMVAFPELSVTGYPPEDLILKPQFVKDNIQCLHSIVDASDGITSVFGFVNADLNPNLARTDTFTPTMPHWYNAAGIAYDRELAAVYHKERLPNYGVFDESRYFKPGDLQHVYIIGGAKVGISICEDIWYPNGPVAIQSRDGADLILNINASPFQAGKMDQRTDMLSHRATENGVFIAYLNAVGGQDELVFDGGSMLFGPTGELIARGSQFREELMMVDIEVNESSPIIETTDSLMTEPNMKMISGYTNVPNRPVIPSIEPTEYTNIGEIYAALVLGTHDYVHKCNFDKVLVALSGGIDSSLVATIAVDALGSKKVVGVSMPSQFSSASSVSDAQSLARNLGIELMEISIENTFSSFIKTLSPHFDGTDWGVTEENLQSRIRGNLVMALSNKFGWLVLTTGNKSEMATGYATIYGDMAGGFAAIKDVSKLLVYELAKYRNHKGQNIVIPVAILEKPPSAELRHGQKDEDTLPPYSTLDPILKAYVEDDQSYDDIVRSGYDADMTRLIVSLVDNSEYKRRQAPPGIKITPRNFGRDRRMPIANQYLPYQ